MWHVSRGAVAAGRRRPAAVERYLPPPRLSAANPPHAAAVDRRDRQTDGRTDGRPTVTHTDPAAHTMLRQCQQGFGGCGLCDYVAATLVATDRAMNNTCPSNVGKNSPRMSAQPACSCTETHPFRKKTPRKSWASTHRGKWGKLTPRGKMDEKLKSENMQEEQFSEVGRTALC